MAVSMGEISEWECIETDALPFVSEQLQSILEQKVKKQRKEKHRKIRKSFRELPFLDALR